MGLIYAINASEYEPISFGDNYLYHQYDKIASFLLKIYGQEYQQILAKPVYTNGIVEWYANYDVELSRIGDLSQDIQVKIKKLYWDLKNRLDKDIDDLEFSSLPEKKKWGTILRQVFDDENNIILSDGTFWCLLWGWKFKNKSENYLAPEFLTSVAEEITPPGEVIELIEEEPPPVIEDEPMEVVEEDPPVLGGQYPGGNPPRKKKNHFWYRVKRFFRNFVYRYWGLLFFILIILFIFCLLEKCRYENCPEIHELNQQLDALNEEIKNRCIEDLN